MTEKEPEARLHEFDKEEWWDVARKVRPTLTRAEYERQWAEFVANKARRKLQ